MNQDSLCCFVLSKALLELNGEMGNDSNDSKKTFLILRVQAMNLYLRASEMNKSSLKEVSCSIAYPAFQNH